MADTKDTCPFCGAELLKQGNDTVDGAWLLEYSCGTICGDGSPTRPPNCYERQLAQKDERIKELEWAVCDAITVLRESTTMTPGSVVPDVRRILSKAAQEGEG